jgi:hypothetical protein
MLYVYTYFKDFNELRENSIDLSTVSSCDLAERCEVLLQHSNDKNVFLGYLEPGWMLDSKHEARIREIIRKFHTTIVCFHLKSLPFSWKNEIDIVYLKK